MYPLARGIAPLLVTGGAAEAGEGLTTWQLIGVAVVAGGLTSLVWLGGHGRIRDRRAVALAVATGVMITAYSLTDGLGVRHAHNPLGYAGTPFVVKSSRSGIALRDRFRGGVGRPGISHGGLVAGLLTIVPGLHTAQVLRAAIVHGKRHAFATALGVNVGVLLWGVGVAVGVSGPLTASARAYTVLRRLGAV